MATKDSDSLQNAEQRCIGINPATFQWSKKNCEVKAAFFCEKGMIIICDKIPNIMCKSRSEVDSYMAIHDCCLLYLKYGILVMDSGIQIAPIT